MLSYFLSYINDSLYITINESRLSVTVEFQIVVNIDKYYGKTNCIQTYISLHDYNCCIGIWRNSIFVRYLGCLMW